MSKIILPYELINHILSYRPCHPIAKIVKGTYHPVAKLIQKYITMYNYTELKNRIDAEQYEKYYLVVSFYDYCSKTKDFYRLEHIRFIEYKHKFTIPPSFDITYTSHLEYAKSKK
jgi:hypothetical protein